MRNLQFVALMLLSALSIGPNLFNTNSRTLASEDCISCETSEINHDGTIKDNVKKLSESLPELLVIIKYFQI